MGTDAEHADHVGHAGHNHGNAMLSTKYDYSPVDRIIATVQPLNLTFPVLIAPPSKKSPDWTVRSDAQNRPLRVNLVVDANTGSIKSRKNFADRPLFDRVIGIGVAVHEGQLFGWFNQALGVFTALGLILLSVSAIILWWKRRLPQTLGAPAARNSEHSAWGLIALIAVLGVFLPFLGISLLVVMGFERWVLSYFPYAQNYLGLTKPAF